MLNCNLISERKGINRYRILQLVFRFHLLCFGCAMSKQPEQQDETLERVLELCTLEPNTTERQLKSEPQMILGFDMPEIIMGMSRTELLDLLLKFPM